MQPVSTIIERNLSRKATCRKGLWLNPQPDSGWQSARSACSEFELFCQNHGEFRYHQKAGAVVEFGAFPEIQETAPDWIICTLPRQKALLDMLLEFAASVLSDDGRLWLAGENKAGIKSAGKLLKCHFGQVDKLDNARHCTLFEASLPKEQASFRGQSHEKTWPLKCQQNELSVASYPGVFAHGRLDPGSALLLDCLSKLDISGKVLDFGCGTGVIGACIATQFPDSRVTFLDNSALALLSCKQTLHCNKLEGEIVASDGLTELNERFDLIISNPPIHSGIKTNNHMSMALLDKVDQYLRSAGQLLIVANRHLPYEQWLKNMFPQVIELTSNKYFKVILANTQGNYHRLAGSNPR